MALFVIADLHLSSEVNKPMDVFGGVWKDYMIKLPENWNATVSPEDTVVVPGDISWATYMDEAAEDFRLLDSLNGRKIILKGNHDYWFETASKLERFFEEEKISSIKLLHNSYEAYGDVAICGTKGADVQKRPATENALKLFNREVMRLDNSISKAKADGFEKILVFLHYPPVLTNGKFNDNPMVEMLKSHKIERCFYGHLHSRAHNIAICEQFQGIEFRLISADFINFTPFEIKI